MGCEELGAWSAVGALIPPRKPQAGGSGYDLSAMGGREFDSNALAAKSLGAVPVNWRLPVLAAALLFSLGACCGVGIGQQAPRVSPSRDACPTATTTTYAPPAPGCVWVPKTSAPVPPAVGVSR